MDGRAVRAQLDHPIIDSDAHYIEFLPMVRERIRKIAGDRVADAFDGLGAIEKTLHMTPEEREHNRVANLGWWQLPMQARDRATAMMPALLHERMDEMGLDFCVLYPTGGVGVAVHPDDEIRQQGSRAFNTYAAEYYAPYADRMTPVAVIPTHTPEEAIETLDHAVKQLGMRAALFNTALQREVPGAVDNPEVAKTGPWYDVLALDSVHDYDPLWAKCVELGINPTFHAAARSWGLRRSPHNYVYNHVGHFAASAHAMAKALFLGGVTRRHPKFRAAFLEGGSSWACQLFADLIEHWEKRNARDIQHLNPDQLDHEELKSFAQKYGPDDMAELMKTREDALDVAISAFGSTSTGGVENLDDFWRCEIKDEKDFVELFADKFYFGCEADDRLSAVGFDTKINHFGARIHSIYSSDIGHWDVADMSKVVTSAYGMVEDGAMTSEDFRRFTFENPAEFWTSNNRDFFQGTAVEKEVDALLTR